MKEVNKRESMIDYIAVDERAEKVVLNTKVVRGMFDGSDHYIVVPKMQVKR